jgi:polyhydroxyalkanoate synthesis regulator phasin
VRDELRRMALFGSGVAELTRHRAEQIVKDLVKVGDVRKGQASGVVKDLLDRSKQNRQEIIKLVRGEIRNQIEALGVATKRDFERLERRVTRLETRGEKAADKSAVKGTGKSSKKKTAKKTAKRTAKKTTERSSSTKAPVSEAAREAAAEASAGTE